MCMLEPCTTQLADHLHLVVPLPLVSTGCCYRLVSAGWGKSKSRLYTVYSCIY
jgi:hypothetical protein